MTEAVVVLEQPEAGVGVLRLNRPAVLNALSNAVMDALSETGVRNIDMPLLPDRVWEALTYRRDVSGFPPVRQD